tara:strand:- start:237 stop:653 length:417 start_codon:yes stop_codon:yes gene_type:complete
MLDKTGMYAGMNQILGINPLNYSDLTPPMSQFDNISNNYVRNIAPDILKPIEKMTRDLNPILGRDPTQRVLSGKPERECMILGKDYTSLTGGIDVNQGYARHQKPGLSIQHDRILDGPIMPLAGFFDPDMLNGLGGLE